MSFNGQTVLLTVLRTYLICCCWSSLVGAQLFEQPATRMTKTNVVYTTYLQRDERAVGGATQLPNHVTAQREPIQITKATELQDIKDSGALAPFLQQLLRQTMPNWQQPQQQQQQQQQQRQQQFFVYENSETGWRESQQPQILQEFNGVNVRQKQKQQQQQQQQQQQRPQSTFIHRQQQQQQFTQLPIQMKQQQQQRVQYFQTAPNIALAPPRATAATATWQPAVGFAAPIGTLGSTFQPISPHANNATDAWCESCCREEGAATMPCSCCGPKPLLSASLLKATVG